MSALTDFLSGQGTDDRGRSLADILAFDDSALEETHDYIQWLFPLTERSQFAPGAPALSQQDIDEIRASSAARENLERAAIRMRRFYKRNTQWLRAHDHNHLRITRIIRSLRLLLDDDERFADSFRSSVLSRVSQAGAPIGSETWRYWSEA